MITKRRTRRRAIHGDAETYEREMNLVLQELEEKEIDVIITDDINALSDQPFASILQWEEVERIPESIKDEMSLIGRKASCKKCPHFNREDRRRKDGLCSFFQEEKSIHDEACDHYWMIQENDKEESIALE